MAKKEKNPLIDKYKRYLSGMSLDALMKVLAKAEKGNTEIFISDTSKTPIPSTELRAIITHHLHTLGVNTGVAAEANLTLERSANSILEDYIGGRKPDLNKGQVQTVVDGTLQLDLFEDLKDVPFPSPTNPKFTFIDLFAGIGGFRIAMQNLGGRCVYSSEFDEKAKETYYANYGEVPFGDITKETTKSYIPDNFDILCAGFPCQAFSLAGKRRGFNEARGTLFFDVAEILKRKQPKGIFLENVKGLKIHDRGKTFEVIKNALDEVGYIIADDPWIVNAMNFGVPQHRERVYIIGVRKDIAKEFGITKETIQNCCPKPTDTTKRFRDVKEENEVSVKYYLSTQYIDTLKKHKARHEAKGNGFGYKIIQDDEVSNAIVVGGMGRECNLVIDNRLTDFTPITNIKGVVNREGIRRMTPREWARLQGYPDKFKIVVADASAYKQFGNSVAVPAIQATAQKLIELLKIK